jgi:hypothetical protein
MSKVKKAKKLRRPNVPLTTGPGAAAGGGVEAAREVRAGRNEPAPVVFDYGYIKQDLRRIGVLAASFIALLVVLSFFIK